MISICVPAYNSLEYLRILVKGLKKNTKVPYELLVHDNGSTDGTEQWLKDNNIDHTRSEENLGFCGVNNALRRAKFPYSMIFNCDMYPLPGWDKAIVGQIEKFQKSGVSKFTISSCLIEPMGDNPEYNIVYAGHDASTFNESLLLGTFMREKNKSLKKVNTVQYSHPILMPTDMMKEMNYLDESYFPGWAVDHDLAVSARQLGCNDFVMLGESRVFHFISKTFRKLPDNVRNRHGQDVFLKKWGFSVEQFREEIEVRKVIDG